jgi:outer membrane lipoprotein SlyB
MAYQVNKFNGTFLVSVADGTIDSTTNIRFVGKNYAGYGQVQNENFLHLLEHFAGASQPSKPVSGQLWYDSLDRKIKVYDGTRFRPVGGATSSATAPLGLSAGEFWFDSLAQQLYCWTGSEFVLVGPESPGTLGETSLTSVTVKDTGNESHTIAKIKSGGTDIAVFSKDTFNLSDADKTLLPNFGRIKKGITLVSTDNDNGITTTASGTVIWGTATSAQRLVDIEDSSVFYDITDFVLKASPTFTTPVTFNTGFILGSVPRAAAEIANGADLLFRTYSTDSKIILLPAGSASTGVLQIDSESVIPSSGVSLGSNADRFYQIFADNIAGTSVVGAFFGNLTGNVTGNLVGNVTGNLTGNVTGNLTGNVTGNASSATNASRLNNTEASDSATNSTVALRTASGNLVANQFVGTTDKADRIKIDNSASDNPASAYKTAMTTQTPLTIAARDSSGDITARIFRGTATAVQAADLAEKYLADKEYDVGTVVIVGGEQEVTASVWVGQRAVGVVSAAPGLMMNQDLEGGTYIALKGRVPVRVIGQVRKGDRLVAAPDGCAMASEDANANTFAVALESSLNTEVKLIEAIVL